MLRFLDLRRHRRPDGATGDSQKINVLFGALLLFITGFFFFLCFCVSGTNTLNNAAAVSAVCFGRDSTSCSHRNIVAVYSHLCLLASYRGYEAPRNAVPPLLHRPPAALQLAALQLAAPLLA